MNEPLESQVAKIQIGNPKSASSYVHVLAEKAPGSEAELYVIAELPLLHPAAEASCERICLAISGSLKRTYKRGAGGESFENAVGQINEELSKLVSLGQTHWIDKLACVVAAKVGSALHIATCGKVAAFLLRGGEFTDISCSSAQSHPLKTFENVASGRLRLHDTIILSTTQLFNYVSLDRLKHLLSSGNFLNATQTTIQLLKDSAGPEVSFGTILNFQVEVGQTPNEEIDLEQYVVEPKVGQPRWVSGALAFLKQLVPKGAEKAARTPQVSVPTVRPTVRVPGLSRLTEAPRHASRLGRLALGGMARAWQRLRATLSGGFQSYSPQKKFFLISVLVLLVAFGLNLLATAHYRKVKQQDGERAQQLTEVANLIANAESALLYKNENDAREFFSRALSSLPKEADLPQGQQGNLRQLSGQLDTLRQKLDKRVEAEVQNLGSLGGGSRLIKLPGYLAVENGSAIVSYNRSTGLIQDGVLLASENIVDAAPIKGSTAVVYTEKGLQVWDYERRLLGPAATLSVPGQADFVALKVYPTNSRVYLINKAQNQILSYAVSGNQVVRPVVASKDANDLKNALDFAIDGSIYVLNTNGITKYQAGKLAEFTMPFLLTPFSGSGKVDTQVDYRYLYILDVGNRRILAMDKRGNLVASITSPQFTDLKDFTVDEKNKTAYVLNGTSLLKATYSF